MTLPEVALGDPHVSAHNNERSAINALQDLSDPVFTAGLSTTFVPSKATAASETAPLGAELFTGGTWTLGAGWSGSIGAGFVYAYPGSGAIESLSWAAPFNPSGKRYQVGVTVASPTSNANFTTSFGGASLSVMYEGGGTNHTYSRGVYATANSGLVITPTVSDWNGTVTAVSVKEIGAATVAPYSWKDSTDTTTHEMRPTALALSNLLMGRDAGRFVTNGHRNVVIGEESFAEATSAFWNVGVGHQALQATTSGSRNVALGVFSLLKNTTGHRNVSIGPFAMRDNTEGFSNIALGVDVFWKNTIGSFNIALGQSALTESTIGKNNIAIGTLALGAQVTLSDNIGIGDYAAASVTSEGQGRTIAIGYRALKNATVGGNLAIGDQALHDDLTGYDNIAIGRSVFRTLTDKGSNVGIGHFVGENVNGDLNTAIGYGAFRGAAGSTATRNVVIGQGALTAVTTAARNLAIGYAAGNTVTTGADNILIGYNVQASAATVTNELNIGNLIYGKMAGANKQVGIGVPGPSARLHLPAGAAIAGQAPLKFTTGGVLTTSPEPGAVEFDGTNVYFTTAAGVRKTLATV